MSDEELPMWRGKISMEVFTHGERLEELRSAGAILRVDLETLRRDLAELRLGLADIRSDLKAISSAIQESHRQELSDLRETIAKRSTSRRELFQYVTAPLMVGLLVGLVLFVLTGAIQH